MEEKREEAKNAKKNEIKKAKYIGKLLETAEKRKKKQKRRIERQVQKEREAEGEMYKDKESFVTTAYRKKFEEIKKAEEEEKREAYLESIGDVTKQKDLGGFYRHIYEQQMGKEETTMDKPLLAEPIKLTDKTKERSYRKRKASLDDKEEDEVEHVSEIKKKAHLQSNLDADSDFSIDSFSDSESDEDTEKKVEPSKINDNEDVANPSSKANITEIKEVSVKIKSENENIDKDDDSSSSTDNEKDNNDKKDVKEFIPPKPKIDIWKKRTVGDVLEAALERYYQRKAAREAG